MQQQQQEVAPPPEEWSPAYVEPHSSWGAFNGVILTDQQLLIRLRKAYPGMWWERRVINETDSWVFHFSTPIQQWRTYSAVTPEDGEWLSWRYGLYMVYIFWQSGGFS